MRCPVDLFVHAQGALNAFRHSVSKVVCGTAVNPDEQFGGEKPTKKMLLHKSGGVKFLMEIAAVPIIVVLAPAVPSTLAQKIGDPVPRRLAAAAWPDE
ncbi:hypothetical protein [Noviherbaspirillum malthae]|uniref:hypothetical protein n=1 Tax=Noviherbaspirillum malthae TaxID=1260987 RepID=UPI00188E2619|nr:hypothetical protein [Noviherbaspirillum malthae]